MCGSYVNSARANFALKGKKWVTLPALTMIWYPDAAEVLQEPSYYAAQISVFSFLWNFAYFECEATQRLIVRVGRSKFNLKIPTFRP